MTEVPEPQRDAERIVGDFFSVIGRLNKSAPQRGENDMTHLVLNGPDGLDMMPL